MDVTEKLVRNSAEAFLAEIRRSAPQWLDATHGPECGWVFRGQPNATLPLVPSAFRSVRNSLLDPLREDIVRKYGSRDWRSQLKVLAPELTCSDADLAATAIDALTHAGVVRLFMAVADEVRRPIVFSELLHHIFNETRDEFSQYFAGRYSGPEQIFAVAQHHGVPTQFLDWTLDPLIAAYFAAAKADPASSEPMAVWALRRDLFDCEWSLCRFTVRAGVTPFLDAQAGLFTWNRRAYIERANRGSYVPFEQVVEEASGAPPLAALTPPLIRKVTLPAAEAVELLKLLWRERVTPAHLMPTFDHVTMAVQQRVRWL